MVHAGIAERGKPQAPTLIIVGGVVSLHGSLRRVSGNGRCGGKSKADHTD
jgi:hypothetical protein